MNAIFKTVLAAAAVAASTQAAAQATFFEHQSFEGRSFTTDKQIAGFERYGFNDRASSVVVVGTPWEVCEDDRFHGRCVVLRPGRYPSLAAMGLNDRVSSTKTASRNARIDDHRYAPAPVAAQVTFYERDGFRGRSFATEKQVANFERYGFNDRASSAVVVGDPWEVCEDSRFGGRCIVLRPGRYASLAAMGLNDGISSTRAVRWNERIDDRRYAPAPVAAYDFRRRNQERLYEAHVTSVRAVVGSPERRCWVEREQLSQTSGGTNVPAAIAGAIIGGILGHQVGGGRGKDLATAGGAVAGAAVGANVGRDGAKHEGSSFQEVERCEKVPSQARADLWDVTYDFRGTEHRIQMTAAPGHSIAVNELGEPRE